MSHPPNTRSSSPESGTTSLIFGDRPSVRLPRRMVPICVSDPIGLANPLRMAKTPAMVVVLTAPRPTSRIPSLPRAGAISTGVGTDGNYISHASSVASRASASHADRTSHGVPIVLNWFRRRGDRHLLVISMIGLKMGDHFVQVGCPDEE